MLSSIISYLSGECCKDVERVQRQVTDQNLVEDAPEALGHAADSSSSHVSQCSEQAKNQDPVQAEIITDPAKILKVVDLESLYCIPY